MPSEDSDVEEKSNWALPVPVEDKFAPAVDPDETSRVDADWDVREDSEKAWKSNEVDEDADEDVSALAVAAAIKSG